jgi:Mg/Co/Ni transporter MgtE
LQCISFSNDTITINDTVNGFYFDTLHQFDTINDFDTLLIDTGGVRVKTIINWKTRTVGQSIKKDTVYLTNTITVTKTQIQKRQYSKLERYTIYFALFVVAVFLAKLFSK